MYIEKICHNIELCTTTLKAIKKILACLGTSKALGLDGISWKKKTKSLKFLKDGAEVVVLSLFGLVKLSIKQSLFPDQPKIAKLKFYFEKALRVTQKIKGSSHSLCL